MRLTRRAVMTGGAALAFAGLRPRLVLSEISLGSGTLTTLSDGSLALPLSLPDSVPQAELTALADRFGLVPGEAPPRPMNVTLWRAGDRLVLIDAGSGSGFVPSAGELLVNLEAAGVAADEVTDVVFTHGHPDHLWGILDDFDDIAFPEARLFLGEIERVYWTDPATLEAMPEDRKTFAVGAARRIEAIADRLQTFAAGDEVVPGLTAVATYGHTPGHMSFRAEANGNAVMILGDAVTNAHLNFARPDWPSDSDQYAAQAADTRAALLPELAASGVPTVGYHLPDGGIGTVEADGDGFRFAPAVPT